MIIQYRKRIFGNEWGDVETVNIHAAGIEEDCLVLGIYKTAVVSRDDDPFNDTVTATEKARLTIRPGDQLRLGPNQPVITYNNSTDLRILLNDIRVAINLEKV